MDTSEITEVELKGILSIINGEEKWGWLGPGIHSYNGTKLHDVCLELEKRKLIYRKHDDKIYYVYWMPRNKECYHVSRKPVAAE